MPRVVERIKKAYKELALLFRLIKYFFRSLTGKSHVLGFIHQAPLFAFIN